METSDQPFERALLYLRAAGHDTGPETRALLHSMLQAHRAENPDLKSGQLLEQIPDWFDLPGPHSNSPLPPIARASIGYPRD